MLSVSKTTVNVIRRSNIGILEFHVILNEYPEFSETQVLADE